MASKLIYLTRWLIVILLYGLVIGSSSLDTGLYFANQPQDVIAIKNAPLVLNCSSQDSDGRVNITWRKDGQLVNDQRRFVLRNGSLYFKRVLRRKQFTDEGLYQCVLRNHIGTIVSRKLQLQVASKSQ
ncbi:Neogenin [Lamellibrachia satsuma]|nr:Neogenin [Lamellibrachia satsuma]